MMQRFFDIVFSFLAILAFSPILFNAICSSIFSIQSVKEMGKIGLETKKVL